MTIKFVNKDDQIVHYLKVEVGLQTTVENIYDPTTPYVPCSCNACVYENYVEGFKKIVTAKFSDNQENEDAKCLLYQILVVSDSRTDFLDFMLEKGLIDTAVIRKSQSPWALEWLQQAQAKRLLPIEAEDFQRFTTVEQLQEVADKISVEVVKEVLPTLTNMTVIHWLKSKYFPRCTLKVSNLALTEATCSKFNLDCFFSTIQWDNLEALHFYLARFPTEVRENVTLAAVFQSKNAEYNLSNAWLDCFQAYMQFKKTEHLSEIKAAMHVVLTSPYSQVRSIRHLDWLKSTFDLIPTDVYGCVNAWILMDTVCNQHKQWLRWTFMLPDFMQNMMDWTDIHLLYGENGRGVLLERACRAWDIKAARWIMNQGKVRINDCKYTIGSMVRRGDLDILQDFHALFECNNSDVREWFVQLRQVKDLPTLLWLHKLFEIQPSEVTISLLTEHSTPLLVAAQLVEWYPPLEFNKCRIDVTPFRLETYTEEEVEYIFQVLRPYIHVFSCAVVEWPLHLLQCLHKHIGLTRAEVRLLVKDAVVEGKPEPLVWLLKEFQDLEPWELFQEAMHPKVAVVLECGCGISTFHDMHYLLGQCWHEDPATLLSNVVKCDNDTSQNLARWIIYRHKLDVKDDQLYSQVRQACNNRCCQLFVDQLFERCIFSVIDSFVNVNTDVKTQTRASPKEVMLFWFDYFQYKTAVFTDHKERDMDKEKDLLQRFHELYCQSSL